MVAFNPKSIAVIGASNAEHKVGHLIFKNLLTQGFKGKVYPVNPKGGQILKQTVHSSVKDIKETVDMAIVVVPAPFVPQVVKECEAKRVKEVVVISAGFSETGTKEGLALEEEINKIVYGNVEIERRSISTNSNMRLVGPNCLGIIRPALGMNASFAKELPAAGNIALVSQSGAMAVAIMDSSPAHHLGYSLVLSIGNKTCLDECDYLEVLAEDKDTQVIGMYLESIKDGQRFLEVATKVNTVKPIVLLKSGVSEHGAEAATSHTGSMAGSDAAIEAACIQAGIRRAQDYEEFLSLLKTLSTQPPLLTNNIAVITNAGGPGILATDAAAAAGLNMPELNEDSLATLKAVLPPAAGLVNPIDVVGDALVDRYISALDVCQTDPNIDGLCVLLTPQVMTPSKEVAKAIIKTSQKNKLMPITTSFMGGDSVAEAIDLLAQNNIPNFLTPADAIKALAALRTAGSSGGSRTSASPKIDTKRQAAARKILEGEAILLDPFKTAELLTLYDLPIPAQGMAVSAQDATDLAETIGYPVIAKISDPSIVHKTDIGGIKANLKNATEVTKAYEEITRNTENLRHTPDVQILVQKFLPIGNEFIVGALRDKNFGPMVMVGLGGIYTELFKDTSFRIAPVTEETCYQMLQELKSWQLLLGMRGKKQSDIAGIVDTLIKLSQLITECDSIKEVDFNPILVGEDGVVLADAKIIT